MPQPSRRGTSLPKSPAAQRDHLSHSPSATGRKRSSNPNRRPCPSFSCPPGQPIPAQPLPRRPGWTPPKSSPYRWQTIASDTSRSCAIWSSPREHHCYTATGRVRLACGDRRRPGRFRLCSGREGSVERVRIPHYGGPLGQATTLYRTSFQVDPAMSGARHGMAVLQRRGLPGRCLRQWRLPRLTRRLLCALRVRRSPRSARGENTLLVTGDNDAICMGNASWGTTDICTTATSSMPPPGRAGTTRDRLASLPARHGHLSGRLHRGTAAGSSSRLFVRPLLEDSAGRGLDRGVSTPAYSAGPVGIELSLFGQNFPETIFV